MRILQLSNKAPYPANDGSSIAIYTLAEGLADNGTELHLLTINTKKHFKPDEQVPQAFKEKTHYRSVFQNTDTSLAGAFSNLFSSQSYFVSRFFFKAFKEELIRKLKEQSFDLVQLEGVFLATYIPVIKQYSKAKIVIRAHNLEHQIWQRHLLHEKNIVKKWYLNLQNNRLKQFELDAFSKADAIVTITDEDKKNIQKLVPQQAVYTCLTGINLNDYKTADAPTQVNTLFHFASMDWMPNEEAVSWLLEQVWPEVLKQLPKTRLVLAGRGMPEKFKRLADKNLVVMEHVNSSFEFYHSYDIMLVPLWSGSGLRIKLVEGLAYGKTIITTSIGAEGIAYTNHKNLEIADTAGDFTNAIISLLTDPLKKRDLQQQARQLAEACFDYKKIAEDLLSFYSNGFK
jgi:glycosyltransferase involved in cell wall biosynthesis